MAEKKRGGSASIRERGDKGILVPVSPALHKLIKAAAGLAGVPMNEFVRAAAEAAARIVVGKGFKE